MGKFISTFRKFIKPITNVINFISEFMMHFRDSKHPEFHLTKRILDYTQANFKSMSNLKITYDNLIETMKSSNNSTEIDNSISEYREEYNKVFDDFVLGYYEKYGDDLIVDLDKSIEWIDKSEWYGTTEMEYLIRFRSLFMGSKIEGEMNYLSKF